MNLPNLLNRCSLNFTNGMKKALFFLSPHCVQTNLKISFKAHKEIWVSITLAAPLKCWGKVLMKNFFVKTQNCSSIITIACKDTDYPNATTTMNQNEGSSVHFTNSNTIKAI